MRIPAVGAAALAAIFVGCGGSREFQQNGGRDSFLDAGARAGDAGTGGNGAEVSPTLFAIETTALPDGQVGKGFVQSISARGGNVPITWSLGVVPASLSWLKMDATNGTLRGLPTAIVTGSGATVEVRATDTVGAVATKMLALKVVACADGEPNDCLVQNANACLRGTQVCTNGQFGMCTAISGGAEVDASQCNALCGTCGANADHCAAGQCRCGAGAACGAGFTCCGGRCVDILGDPDHCGGCAGACDTDRAHATRICLGGMCAYPCEPGWERCPYGSNERGCSTVLSNDPTNCGGCGHVCAQAPDHVAEPAKCQDGRCVITACLAGFADCNSDVSDGCEQDISQANNSCGCSNVCPESPPNAMGAALCEGAKCKITACKAGYGDCNGNAFDGCETNLVENDENCGACGHVCPIAPAHASKTHCHLGKCLLPLDGCEPSFANCDHDGENGCEVDLRQDVANCGSCGWACPNPDPSCKAIPGTGVGCPIVSCQDKKCCKFQPPWDYECPP